MTNKTKIALVSGLIIIALTSYAVFHSKNVEKNNIREKAWVVLQNYLELAKAHDIDGLASISYQMSESCKNASQNADMKKDCEARMDTVYNFGSGFKKEDFINIWSDSKQIILATDWSINTEGDFTTRMRIIIYFIIDPKEEIKVLSFKPTQGTIISKYDKDVDGVAIKLSDEELNDRLIKFTEDKDQDGVEDYVETCSGTSDTDTCIKTNPNKRDTDGDGYWDGVQALFYK